jgi:hypothetical protein
VDDWFPTPVCHDLFQPTPCHDKSPLGAVGYLLKLLDGDNPKLTPVLVLVVFCFSSSNLFNGTKVPSFPHFPCPIFTPQKRRTHGQRVKASPKKGNWLQ